LPLSQHDEVGLYIASRLKTAGYEGQELFAREAVEKITHYSNGIPRLINVVCDNALMIAYAASKKHVSGEMIEEVARDLNLTGETQVKAEAVATDTELSADFEPVFRPREPVVGDPRDSDFEPPRPTMHAQPRRRRFAGLGIGLMLGMAISAGIILYSQETGSLAALNANFKNLAGVDIKDLVGLDRENPERAQPELSTEVVKEVPSYNTPEAQIPESREAEPPVPEPNQNGPASSEIEKPDVVPEAATPRQITKPKETPQNPANAITQHRFPTAPHDAPLTAEQLEFEIYKAIYNRAIRGVEVSVRDGTAYLSGRVATEKQKLVAGRAARSVPGVKEVRDQIIVGSP
jgi:hypothetical protein